MNLSLYAVTSVIILDNTGTRVFARYFQQPHNTTPSPYPTLASQKAFESGLFEKTKKNNSDIILYDSRVICFKASIDLIIYVVGNLEENELMLYSVVMAIKESLELLLRAVDKRTLLENYDLLALTVDEIVDDGIVLETDVIAISTRVSKAPTTDSGVPLDFSEKGLMNAYQIAKEGLRDRILKGGL